MFAAPKDPSEDNFMFDIRTPNRLYYLRCETEQEMNRWVDCLCQVCGLKAQTDDMAPGNPILPHPPGPSHLPSLQPPNTGDSGHFSSPSSISNISGPYIPISECITGRKASTNNSNNQSNNSSTGASSRFPFQTSPNNRRMSIPTEMAPSAPLGPSSLNPSTSSLATTASSTSTLVADNHHLGGYGGRAGTTLTLPSSCGTKPRADGAQHSYDHPRSLRSSGGRHHTRSSGAISDEGVRSPQGTDSSSSVFTEEEWPSSIPHSAGGQSLFGGVDGSSWETDAIATHALRSHVKDANKIASLGLSGDSDKGAPPRPPKPAHLEVPQQNYMNIDTIVRATNSRKNSIADSSTRKLINVQNHDGTIASSSDAEPSPLSASSSLASGNTPGCVITEDQYEFPRSHARESMSGSAGVSDRPMRHCYNNAAPSSVTSDRVFSYDLRDAASLPPNELDPRISPALYTNIAALTIKSPVGPPSVDRGLKPKMSSSDGSSLSGCDSSPCITNSDSVGPPPSSAAPVVHRNLKPPSSKGDSNDIFGNSSAAVGNNVGVAPEFVLEPAPRSRPKGSSSNNDSRSGVTRAAPSPTPPSLLEDDMQTPPSSAHIFRNSVMQDEPVSFYAFVSLVHTNLCIISFMHRLMFKIRKLKYILKS